MKASISISSEMDITLDEQELSKLEQQALSCIAQIRELPPELNQRRSIGLSIKPTRFNLYLELESFPNSCSFEKIRGYQIIISSEGYGLLKKNKAVCDRTGGPSRVNIYVR